MLMLVQDSLRNLSTILFGVLVICFAGRTWSQESQQHVGNQLTDEKQSSAAIKILNDENLVAWCIVPFDAGRRSPEQRARMLVELGIQRCAYDWRDEHVNEFEDEILAYQKHGIEFFAFWGQHDRAFELFKKHDLHPQIWQMIGDPGGEESTKVARAADRLRPLAERTQALRLPLALYNHMNWDGEPENMVAVCQRLHEMGFDHVGIVYNFHHGHSHVDRWKSALRLMMPYLKCVNLNGMNDGAVPKILGLGKGQFERQMVRDLIAAGYAGPIGIIDHRPELDAKESLTENLVGLRQIRRELSTQLTDPQSSIITSDLLRMAEAAAARGNADRGAAIFGSDQTACISCHSIQLKEQTLGGSVGPQLVETLHQQTEVDIVQSLMLPNQEVAGQYELWHALTLDGSIHSGYRLPASESQIRLKEISSDRIVELSWDDVDTLSATGSAMPAELLNRLTPQQRLDLIAFLLDIRNHRSVSELQFQTVKDSHNHGPATFPYSKDPIDRDAWPNHSEFVNRDRVYDFYTKQAEHFRRLPASPVLIDQYPGLDGGTLGHWGNQNEKTWEDGRWNQTLLGSMQSGVWRHQDQVVPRAVCVQFGNNAELACCFDTDNLCYRAVWRDGFVSFSQFRHGFLDGLRPTGDLQPIPTELSATKSGRYLGLFRLADRVVFKYLIDDIVMLDAPYMDNGQLLSEVAPLESHSLRAQIANGGAGQWPQSIPTKIQLGKQRPFAIDDIELPLTNPWQALLFPGGHDFLADGSAMVCTIEGDVWHVSGLQPGSEQANWKRFATGLHHPLGLWIDADGIFVQCRDQIVRLHDLNGNDEADYYECISQAFSTSPAGHDFICDLQRDSNGNFLTASGNEGLVRISADGRQSAVIGTGFRNPDGLGLLGSNFVTVPCSEGEWTATSMICAVPNRKGDPHGKPPHYGYRGPREGQPPSLPMVYLPRGLDNSSGGQVAVPEATWGPLSGQLLHLSFGAGSWFSIPVDSVDGQLQGAAVPMRGDFGSGVHRGRFSKADGQLYVSGMQGWGSYTKNDGCFQRVRFTGDSFQQPVGFHAHRNGMLIRFGAPIDPVIAAEPKSHFAQSWNYRYSGAYGSAEYSPSHPGVEGHDPLAITRAAVIDANTLFLEIPDLQPVNQLHLRMHVNADDQFPSTNPAGTGHDLFATIHRLDVDFEDFADYRPFEKNIAAHPMLVDLATAAVSKVNPWLKPTSDSERQVELRAGKNLTFETTELHVQAGESISFTLVNPDVVPHNFVLVQPGQLNTVGELANRLISSPEAFARHYVPDAKEVILYTDIVQPNQQQTIHFRAPNQPGRYPYLCSFPGHWMVMNGLLVVE